MSDEELIAALRGTAAAFSAALDHLEAFIQRAKAGGVPGPAAIELAESYVARERA